MGRAAGLGQLPGVPALGRADGRAPGVHAYRLRQRGRAGLRRASPAESRDGLRHRSQEQRDYWGGGARGRVFRRGGGRGGGGLWAVVWIWECGCVGGGGWVEG